MKFGYLLLLALLFTAGTAWADQVEMIYDKAQKPIGLIGLNSVMDESDSGCGNHLGFFEVDEIAYDGVSEIIGGIRVKKLDRKTLLPNEDGAPLLMRFDTKALSNADNSWVPTLVKKGTKLLIAYNLCGSGGFFYARDIYIKLTL